MRSWFPIVCAMAASCALGEVALEGKECPCAVGWICDERTNVCVRSRGPSDGGSSTDAAGVDAFAPADAGDDASPSDAAPGDAAGGPIDGGASSDGGTTLDGGVSIDGGPSPSACTGPLAGALFCDGFEDGDGFAAWTSVASEEGGVVSWVEDPLYRGRGALRVESGAPGGKAWVQTTTSSVDAGDYWFRVYVYSPASASLSHYNFAFSGPSSGPGSLSYYVIGGRPQAWLDEHSTFIASSAALPRDTWTCVEYHLVVSETEGSISIFVDGALVGEGTGLDTRPAEGYSELGLGITYSPATEPATVMYFDEVAVGTSRLPCD